MFVGVVFWGFFSSFAVEFLLYSGHRLLTRYVLCKHYVPFRRFLFICGWLSSLCRAFGLVVPSLHFCFSCLCFWCHLQKTTEKGHSRGPFSQAAQRPRRPGPAHTLVSGSCDPQHIRSILAVVATAHLRNFLLECHPTTSTSISPASAHDHLLERLRSEYFTEVLGCSPLQQS